MARNVRRSFTRATRRPGAWSGGVALGLAVPASSPVLVELWDPYVTGNLLSCGKVTHQVTHLSIAMSDPVFVNATHHPCLGYYVRVFQTDAGLNVPAVLIATPFANGLITQELLDFGLITWRDPATKLGDIVRRALKGKRRMDDTEVLGLVMQMSYRVNVPGASDWVEFDVAWRTFMREAKP